MNPPTAMKAWRVVSHGEPEQVMELHDVPVPEPGPGEVLVRVRAVAVNFPDVLLARGEYQERPALPFVPGIELCGDVVALGPGAQGRVRVGDRVVGSRIGVLAQYATVPVDAVHAAPSALDDAQAAALTIAYQTAWFGLHRRAGLRAGETLLVHAAAGGVGAAACRLGAAAGARVVGVVGGAGKVAAARAAGADEVLLRDDDWVAALRDPGVDVVFDPVGGDSFERSTRCVAFEGRIVVVGFASGRLPAVRPDLALVKNYTVLGLHWALYQRRRPDLVDAAHAELTRLADSGVLRPALGAVVGFDRAPAAVARLAGGTTTGRLVVQVADDAVVGAGGDEETAA